MTEMVLTKTRIQAGIYEGVLQAELPDGAMPPVEVLFENARLDGLTVTADPSARGTWTVKLTIPAEVLTDGVQTFAFVNADTNALLDSFSVITGEPLDDDLRAELDLLRAELDMLKKAFRRHCVETT